MKRLFFSVAMILVALAYSAEPQAVAAVKKEVTEVVCKCDEKCTSSCLCPQCPNKEAVKVKEAAARIVAETITSKN